MNVCCRLFEETYHIVLSAKLEVIIIITFLATMVFLAVLSPQHRCIVS